MRCFKLDSDKKRSIAPEDAIDLARSKKSPLYCGVPEAMDEATKPRKSGETC